MQRFLGTRRSRIIAGFAAAVMVLCVIAPGLTALVQYQRARSGLAHLKNAQTALGQVASHPFDAATISRARSEFDGAAQDFGQVSGSIGLFTPYSVTPGVGSKVGGAIRLVPIAAEASQAGVLACDILSILLPKLKDPMNPSANGVTAADFAAVSAKYAQIQGLVAHLLQEVQALQPSDLTLDARLGPAIASLRAKLPQIQQLLTEVPALLQLAPTLFGVDKPATYLVEVLDSTELRAGGGFIGNYGVLTLTSGHLNGLQVKDVDLLDAPYKYGSKVIPLPAGYQWFSDTSPKWGFRDSNLDADFPTSAKYGESLYTQEGGAGDPQGVIAITPWLIQSALRLTGPVSVPEYKETVTADTMIPLIHKYQLTNGLAKGPDNQVDPKTGTSLRKQFTGFLFKHFMEAVKTQSSQDMSKYLKLFVDALQSKDVQIYFNAPDAEKVLLEHHMGSAIEAPSTGESLMAVDANVVASKINYFFHYTLSDHVTLDSSGTATHTSTLTYDWPKDPATLTESFPAGYPYLYIGYLRFYAPPTAQLQGTAGWQTSVSNHTAFGRSEWGGKVFVSYGTRQEVSVTWTVPHAATQVGSGWSYTTLIQKQAGVVNQNLDYQLTLPACATRTGTLPSGVTAPTPKSLAVAQPLTKDLSLAVTYTC